MFEILKNKNVFISGASGGIGSSIALELGKCGCNLYLTGRSDVKLENLKNEILKVSSSNTNVFYTSGDLNEINDINEIVNFAKEKLNNIDVLINCAGIFNVKSLELSTLEDYEKSFNLHVRSAFWFSKEFSKDMIENSWGRIVNIGSSSAYDGFANTSLYCSSKHALLGFSRSLNKELKQYNIRTYCISPSGTKTDMGRSIPGQDFDTFLDPKEIAKYVAFVISFNNELITDEIRLNRFLTQ